MMPSKRKLKLWNELRIIGKEDKYFIDKICSDYELSLEDAYRFFIESKDEYIYVNENFGFTITETKVIPEDWDGGCKYIYRCSAKLFKL
jgi:hypothetical protein